MNKFDVGDTVSIKAIIVDYDKTDFTYEINIPFNIKYDFLIDGVDPSNLTLVKRRDPVYNIGDKVVCTTGLIDRDQQLEVLKINGNQVAVFWELGNFMFTKVLHKSNISKVK